MGLLEKEEETKKSREQMRIRKKESEERRKIQRYLKGYLGK